MLEKSFFPNSCSHFYKGKDKTSYSASWQYSKYNTLDSLGLNLKKGGIIKLL